MESITTNTFNKVLMDRCKASGWDSSIVNLLIITTQEGHRNLVKDFGRISLEEVAAHCATYIQDETRQAQNQYQLYQCLMNSLTEQRLNLKVRGGVTHDLLTNLWKAYSSVQDSAFVSYIQRKRDAYDEGEGINVEKLMKQAENKFKTLVLQEKWNSKTKEQYQIISLTATINKLKDEGG